MKRRLFYVLAAPLLFSARAFQGNCQSQCEEVRQELIKDCRNDLGPNNETIRFLQNKANILLSRRSRHRYLPDDA